MGIQKQQCTVDLSGFFSLNRSTHTLKLCVEKNGGKVGQDEESSRSIFLQNLLFNTPNRNFALVPDKLS